MALRIFLLFAIAAMLALPALAAAKAPTVTAFKIYRTPNGPDKGAITVISTLGYRGFAKAADFPKGAVPPVSRAIVTLTGANAAVTARDVMRLHPRTRDGAPVRFDFRIPAAKARALVDRKVKVAFAVSLNGRTSKFATKTTRAARQLAASCFIVCPVNPSASPAPSIAFGQTASLPVLCVNFSGTGFEAPSVYPIQVADADGNSIWGGNSWNIYANAVAADGTFSAAGFEQPILNPALGDFVTLSGTVPTSVLTAAPTAATGAAVVSNSGAPFGQIPNPVAAPYQPNNSWC